MYPDHVMDKHHERLCFITCMIFPLEDFRNVFLYTMFLTNKCSLRINIF